MKLKYRSYNYVIIEVPKEERVINMEDKELMEILVDTNHIMYAYCSDHENCKNCILRTPKGTLCLGEKYYQMLKEINNNYKKIKEGK